MDRRFFRYELRTLDLDGARAFYRAVLALDAWPGELAISTLPEAARARGAPSHWLGHVGVEAPDAALAPWSSAGATRLGPPRSSEREVSIALTDPQGARIALTTAGPSPIDSIVAWHHLNSPDADASLALYGSLLGWSLRPGRTFAWTDAGEPVGSARTIVDPTRTHPAWYFFFRVHDLEAALERVRARGGVTLPTLDGPNAARLAACDDPSGAAFGLFARA